MSQSGERLREARELEQECQPREGHRGAQRGRLRGTESQSAEPPAESRAGAGLTGGWLVCLPEVRPPSGCRLPSAGPSGAICCGDRTVCPLGPHSLRFPLLQGGLAWLTLRALLSLWGWSPRSGWLQVGQAASAPCALGEETDTPRPVPTNAQGIGQRGAQRGRLTGTESQYEEPPAESRDKRWPSRGLGCPSEVAPATRQVP